MTNGLATIGLIYDGVDLQPSDLRFTLHIVAGLDDSPDVRGEDVTIPYLDGKLPRPRRFDHRRIVLEGFVRGLGSTREESTADYRTNRHTLAALFDPTRDVADLVATLETGTIATISCRPLPSLSVDESIQSEFAVLSYELEAVSDWEYGGS